MKYLFELNHPKHYYQFKYIMQMLRAEGHTVDVIARDKDVLLKVLEEEKINYEIFGVHKKNVLAKLLATFSIVLSYAMLFRRYQSDVIISKASFYGCLVARLFRKKSIIFPDSEVVVVTNKIVVPLASMVVTPETFELDFGEKHIKVSGFFENCYLSPSVFTPDNTMIDKYNLKTPYAIFRFIGWTANHDLGKNGFSLEEKIKAVELVNKNMAVYISSEVTLPEALEKYKLKTPASSIHQVLSFADLYFGDSQTMATESALLGTPSIRSNSFVGENDMSNFKILENKYKLLHNIADFESVYKKLEDYSQNSHKNEWLRRRDIYTRLVGDTNSIIVDLILSI